MDLQKLFPKSAIDWEILCNNSAKTRFDSYNIPANVLQNCASSFAFCNSSWSLCCRQDFSKCFRLLSIDLGTWFSSDLRFADEFCLIGSSSFTESVYKFDKSSTRLPSFDEVMNTGAAAADESVNQSINQSINQPINQSINQSRKYILTAKMRNFHP